MQIGEFYPATVVRFNQSGAVVQVDGYKNTDFIHISKISSKFVNDISHFLNIGERYSVECIEGRDRPIELSLLHLDLQPKVQSQTLNKCVRTPETKSSPQPVQKKPLTFEDMLNAVQSDFKEKQSDINTRLRRRQRAGFIKC